MASQLLLKLFRVLLHFYPKEYQHEYQEEMLETTREMVEHAPTNLARLKMSGRLLKDYSISIIAQHASQFERSIFSRPPYIRWGSFMGTLLVMPYIFVCAYNLLNQTILHRAVPIIHWEVRAWAIYAIILPVAAFLVVLAVAAIHTYKVISSRRSLQVAALSHDALLLGVPLTLITTIAFL
jgi:hypothetical protein